MRQEARIARVLSAALLLIVSLGSTGCVVGIARYGRAEVYRENKASYRNDAFTYPASTDASAAKAIVRKIVSDSTKYTVVREQGDTLFLREVTRPDSAIALLARQRVSADSMRFKNAKAKEKFIRDSKKQWEKDSAEVTRRTRAGQRSCYVVIANSNEGRAWLTFGLYEFSKIGSADDNYTATRLRDALFWKIRDEFLRNGSPFGPQIRRRSSE
jgi:hypothetical protein